MCKNKNSFFKVHSAVCCVSQSSLHLSNDRIRFYYSKTQLRQRKITETHINVIVRAARRLCNGILPNVKKKGKNKIVLYSSVVIFFPRNRRSNFLHSSAAVKLGHPSTADNSRRQSRHVRFKCFQLAVN